MRFVIDASVTLCWLFRDEINAVADVTREMLASDSDAAVPLIWWFEIRNSIVTGLRRQRVEEDRVNDFLGRIARTPIRLAEISGDADIFRLAQRHRLTFYDACYLELAQRERIALATLDDALARAARAEGVSLIGAS